MAASFVRSLLKVTCLVVGVLFSGSEAGLAAAPVVAPLATSYLAAPLSVPVFQSQGVLRSAYSQLVGRSYAPSFVPVASSLAYAAPVAPAVPTAYVAPQLVAGPVLKTLAAPAAPLATPFAAIGAPLAYAAAPVATPAVTPVLRAATGATTVAAAAPLAPAFAPSAVLAARFAPLPVPGAPIATPAAAPAGPATSLPGVVEARNAPDAAPQPTQAATRSTQQTILTAFGSPEGLRLVSAPGFDAAALAGVASGVETVRASPAAPQAAGLGRSAAGLQGQAGSNQENFVVPQPQPTPFSQYGVPAAPVAPVNP